MKTIPLICVAATLIAFAAPLSQAAGVVEYEERFYNGADRFPLKASQVEEILKRESKGHLRIDLATQELLRDPNRKPPWMMKTDHVRIETSGKIWLLRTKRIGFVNFYLVRRDAAGKPLRIVRRQLGEEGECYDARKDLLRHARPGDLILGMLGV